MDISKLDTFTLAYVECALWSSSDDDGEPLDRKSCDLFTPSDLCVGDDGILFIFPLREDVK